MAEVSSIDGALILLEKNLNKTKTKTTTKTRANRTNEQSTLQNMMKKGEQCEIIFNHHYTKSQNGLKLFSEHMRVA